MSLFPQVSFAEYGVRIFSIALVLLFLFTTPLTHRAGAQNNPSVVNNIKSAQIATNTGKVFLLNDNGSVHTFDPGGKELSASQRIFSFPLASGSADEIFVSPSGDFFVLVKFANPFILHIAVYKSTALDVDSEGAIRNFTLSRGGAGEKVFGVFSPDENELYVAGSLTGKVFVLDLNEESTLTEIEVGKIIVGIEADTKQARLFVLSNSPDVLTVINAKTRSVSGRFPVGNSPIDVLYNERLDRVFVSNSGDNTVNAIDVDTNETETISVGSVPISMTYDKSNGEVFVATNGDGFIYTLRPRPQKTEITKMPIGTVAYLKYPIWLWYSNKTKKLAALNSSTRKLYFIDVLDSRVLKEVQIQGWPRVLYGGEDQQWGAAPLDNTNRFLSIDTDTMSVSYVGSSVAEEQDLVLSSPHKVAVDLEARRIYVGNVDSGNISVLDSDTLKRTATISFGSAPNVFYFDDEARKLYVTDAVENAVFVIDVSHADYPVTTIPMPGMPRSISALRSLGKLYVTIADKKSVVVIDAGTNSVKTVIPLGEQSVFPLVISPNEEKNEIYIANFGADSISVIDAIQDTVKKTIRVGAKPIWVYHAPTLNRLFVTVEGEKKLVVIDPNTLEVAETVAINGIPYRIFVDEATGFVYINKRGEKDVAVFRVGGDGNLQLLKDTEIRYLGELATIYNMMARDTGRVFNQKTERVYFSSQHLNQLAVTTLDRDDDGIMEFKPYAVVSANGKIYFFETKKSTSFNKYVGMAILAILVILFTLFIKSRSKKGEPSQNNMATRLPTNDITTKTQ